MFHYIIWVVLCDVLLTVDFSQFFRFFTHSRASFLRRINSSSLYPFKSDSVHIQTFEVNKELLYSRLCHSEHSVHVFDYRHTEECVFLLLKAHCKVRLKNHPSYNKKDF